jgi:general secretion pathway protein K
MMPMTGMMKMRLRVKKLQRVRRDFAMKAGSRQTGLALVIVIWVLSLLTIMAGSFALTMRRETTVISAVKDNAVLLAAAASGINIAQQMLILEEENSRWRGDGSIYSIDMGDTEIRVRVLSESGKVDINKADEVMLTKLLATTDTSLEQQQSLVSAIIDWRDADELVHLNGAEQAEYEQAGLAYSVANKPFQLVEELRMVMGMDETLFRQLQPLVTVYGQSKVNLVMAGKEVLQAIGEFDADVLDEYLRQRQESYQAQLPLPALPVIEEIQTGPVSTNKQVYTLIAQARVNGQSGAGIQTIVIQNTALEGNAFQVLDWKQIYLDFSLFSDDMTQHLLTVQNESELDD